MIRRLSILLLAAAACAHPAPPAPIAVPAPPERAISSEPDPDERAVYAALIDQDLARREPVFIADTTVQGMLPDAVLGVDSAAAGEMVGDFRERNRMPIAFPADAGAGHGVRLFAASEVLVLADGGRLHGGYAVFVRKFPGVPGFYRVSRPGFDAARRHALVTTVYDCGDLCAEGDYVVLERGADGWRIVTRRTLWVS